MHEGGGRPREICMHNQGERETPINLTSAGHLCTPDKALPIKKYLQLSQLTNSILIYMKINSSYYFTIILLYEYYIFD